MYYFYIAIFGALGAAARYWISSSMSAGAFPFHTLLVNITGCFLLAMVLKYLSLLPGLSKNLITGLGTGFLGSFTTFSTFSAESARLIAGPSPFTALCYIAASIGGGFLAAGFGFYLSNRLIQRREQRSNDN